MIRLKHVAIAEFKRLSDCFKKAKNQEVHSKQYTIITGIGMLFLAPAMVVLMASLSIILLFLGISILIGTVKRYIKRVYKRLKAI